MSLSLLIRRYDKLSDEDKDTLKRFARRCRFPAGEWIAEPSRPLVGAHVIEDGVVGVSDDQQVDLSARGIVFERGDTFGEYSLLDQMGHIPPASDTDGVIALYLRWAANRKVRPFPSGLRALSDVQTLYLAADQYAGAAAVIKNLNSAVIERVQVNMCLPHLVSALLRHPDLSRVPPHLVVDLAQNADTLPVGPRPAGTGQDYRHDLESVFAQRKHPLKKDDWLFVAQGEVMLSNSARLLPGTLFRYDRNTDPKSSETRFYGAVADTWLVRLPGEAVTTLANGNGTRPIIITGAPPPPARRVALMTTRPRDRTPLSTLTALLAGTVQRELPKTGDDRTGLVVARSSVAPGDDARLAREAAAAVNVTERRCDPEPGQILAAVEQLEREGMKTIFIDTDHDNDGKPLDQLGLHKLVCLCRRSFERLPEALSKVPLVRCVVLRDTELGSYLAYHPRTVRLAFDDLPRLSGVPWEELAPRDRASLSRCARAIADRRVGLALGGGGVWGFAHVALLQQLARVDMPIDVISGVSFGSLAAAFYVTGGVTMLNRLLTSRFQLQGTLLASSLVPPLLELYLNSHLDQARLEFLETAFYPVALNLQTGEEWSPSRGTVAYGVRASSSPAGVLSPVIERDVRSVDGGYLNAVPEGVLAREGVDFVVASDVSQAPPPAPDFQGSPLNRFFSVVSPLERIRDNLRALAFATKVSDERDRSFAHERFRPTPTQVAMWDFTKAHQVRDSAQEKAADFATAVRRRWANADWGTA